MGTETSHYPVHRTSGRHVGRNAFQPQPGIAADVCRDDGVQRPSCADRPAKANRRWLVSEKMLDAILAIVAVTAGLFYAATNWLF